MDDQKIYRLRKKARELAKIVHPPPPERDVRPKPNSTLIPEFRPITGTLRTATIPRIKRGTMRRRGRPKLKRDPMVIVKAKVPKREKIQWQRAAADLNMPLAVFVRTAMRYFMGGKRMRSLIAQGKLEATFRKRVSKHRLWERAASVTGDAPRTEPGHEYRPKRPQPPATTDGSVRLIVPTPKSRP